MNERDLSKIEELVWLQDDELDHTCALMFIFNDAYGDRLLGTQYVHRAVLVYNNDAYGASNSPFYKLVGIYEFDNEEMEPMHSIIEKWYKDVPFIEPMDWVVENLI